MMHDIFGNNPGRIKDAVAAFANRQSPLVVATYKDLIIEERAYRRDRETEKVLLTYNQSLARLRQAGFERHLRPQEAFGLLIDSLEGKLSEQEQAITNDMQANYGEFLSMAVERKGNTLVLYLDPENLVYQDGVYAVQGQLHYAEMREFDIQGIPSSQYVDMSRLPTDCVEYIYTRPFSALPEKMREGTYKAQVFLSSTGIWPVGCVGFDWFYVDGRDVRASRGVRSAQKNFT